MTAKKTKQENVRDDGWKRSKRECYRGLGIRDGGNRSDHYKWEAVDGSREIKKNRRWNKRNGRKWRRMEFSKGKEEKEKKLLNMLLKIY